ncbi:oxidoreductase [Chloroflexota bacterium]
MSDYGLLVDYEYCTACHACEVACKQEHRIEAGKTGGVKVVELLQELPSGGLDIINMPILTHLCYFCAPRIKNAQLPACVQHCLADCLKFGLLDDINKEVPRKRKAVIYTLR